MSLPDSPVPDDVETDPSEDEDEVEEEVEEEIEEEDEAEEEVEEEEIEEEVEEEDVEEEVEEEEVDEVDEDEVEEEEVEEVEEEEEVEEMELEEEEEEDEEEEGEQEVEEVEVEEEEIEGEEEEEEEVEVEVEEEEEEGEQEVEEGEEEVQEEEGEEEQQEQEEAVEDKKEEQQQQQREAVEEKKEEHPQQQQEVAEEKKEEQRQQREEAVEEKKKEQEQQQGKAVEETKKEQQLQQEAMKEKEGQQEEEAVGEDRLALTASPTDADNDLSLHMESKEQDKNLGPDYSVAENPEVIPPSSVHCMEENDAMLKISVPSCEILTSKKEEELHLKYDISSHSKSRENLTNVENCRSQGLEVDGENPGSLLQKETHGGYSELGCNNKANLCDDNDIDSRVRATKSSSDTGEDMVIGLLPIDCIVEDASGGQNSRNNIKQLEMEKSRDEMKQTLSRTRSMSPSAEIKNKNKRQKIICDFFAKGWCIRGSSCSFLHIKDTVDKTDQEAEADLVTAHQKRKLKVEEGVRENVQRIRTNEQEQTPSWHPSQEKQNVTPGDNLFPENRFAFSSTSNYFNPNQDGMATLRNQHMYKGYASTLLSHSPNSSLVTQFPASSMSLSHRISSQSACSLPFSSSLGAGNLNAQKLLSTDKEYHTSKSTFSGSGREDYPLVSSSSVPSYPTGYKSKISSYDWEPSVPFRPSFFITPMNVSSPGDLYDPLRDSIDIPNIGDGSLKASLLIQGSKVLASSQAPMYGDSAVIGKYTSSVNDDKSSVSSHNKFYENEPNKNSVPHEKDYLPTETEITSGTYVNYQNGKIGTGQNTFGVADSTKKEREMNEHDARRHGEGSGHKTKRGERDKKNHAIDVDFHMDGSMQKETKALKMLRAALVDHVKELLKPVWHEGRLSKDAHIMIVRKSVDKVVSTIEPHQIPTIDTAKQYVSSSRAKIAKLVNGYVNKYGKS